MAGVYSESIDARLSSLLSRKVVIGYALVLYLGIVWHVWWYPYVYEYAGYMLNRVNVRRMRIHFGFMCRFGDGLGREGRA